MSKLQSILNVLIYVWIIGVFLKLLKEVGILYKHIHSRIFDSNIISSSSFSMILVSMAFICLLIYMLWHLRNFKKVVKKSKNTSLFNNSNYKAFHSVGMAFIYYTVARFTIRIVEFMLSNVDEGQQSIAYQFGRNIGEGVSNQFPLLIVALFLLIIAELIKDGYQLKKENDLTI
ncbi:MAG: DUF2975 domain-containing protein [Maribacter sp.]|nr:DUF2975 domain-containing protein [Maribacter sp.]